MIDFKQIGGFGPRMSLANRFNYEERELSISLCNHVQSLLGVVCSRLKPFQNHWFASLQSASGTCLQYPWVWVGACSKYSWNGRHSHFNLLCYVQYPRSYVLAAVDADENLLCVVVAEDEFAAFVISAVAILEKHACISTALDLCISLWCWCCHSGTSPMNGFGIFGRLCCSFQPWDLEEICLCSAWLCSFLFVFFCVAVATHGPHELAKHERPKMT